MLVGRIECGKKSREDREIIECIKKLKKKKYGTECIFIEKESRK
jgi:hypothetical protein